MSGRSSAGFTSGARWTMPLMTPALPFVDTPLLIRTYFGDDSDLARG